MFIVTKRRVSAVRVTVAHIRPKLIETIPSIAYIQKAENGKPTAYVRCTCPATRQRWWKQRVFVRQWSALLCVCTRVPYAFVVEFAIDLLEEDLVWNLDAGLWLYLAFQMGLSCVS